MPPCSSHTHTQSINQNALHTHTHTPIYTTTTTTTTALPHAGALQFCSDAQGVASVFAPFTGRPAAHFRELLAASRLLSLGDELAADVVRRASGLAVAAGATGVVGQKAVA